MNHKYINNYTTHKHKKIPADSTEPTGVLHYPSIAKAFSETQPPKDGT